MWNIIGQDHLLNGLESSFRQKRQSHAYLLCGPPHVGKMALAINLCQAINCLEGSGEPCGSCDQCTRIAEGNHSDIRILSPGQGTEGRAARIMIGINELKESLRRVHLNPYEGSTSVVIINGAEFMSDECANALLKTLEEPPPQVMFLLLTANESAVLPTVQSRCQTLNLVPISKDKMVERLVNGHQASREKAEQLFRLSRGCMGWAINALNDAQVLEQRQADLEKIEETLAAGLETRFTYANEVASLFSRDREAANNLLSLWLSWWRDLLLIKEGAEDFLHNTDHADSLRTQASGLSTSNIMQFINRLIQTLSNLDNNANPRLTMEVLMINLPIEAGTV
ncbi:MAG: DNA polymerase III subunit delta' [Dehalococcoidia bacterium]|nr:DNA polymerase III subunit delta' [Dehalococcoidia bacterium]